MAATSNTPNGKAMLVEPWPIDRPRPYPHNPRRISDIAIAKVAASIREFGFRQPIVVHGDGVVIAGHTRLAAASSLGLASVPVHIARDLTPVQARAYRLADNRTGRSGLHMRLPPDAIFRYVRLDRLEDFMTLGWLPASELGPVHGYYSILAAWICECPARVPS